MLGKHTPSPSQEGREMHPRSLSRGEGDTAPATLTRREGNTPKILYKMFGGHTPNPSQEGRKTSSQHVHGLVKGLRRIGTEKGMFIVGMVAHGARV